LILDICPNARVRHYDDEYPSRREPIAISFPFERIEKLLGMKIEEQTVERVLNRLGFAPRLADGQISVTVPTNRSAVTIPEVIIEDAARIVGYDNLPATLPVGETPHVERDPQFLMEREARNVLTGAGAFEARSYITVSEENLTRWKDITRESDPAHTVRL